MSRLMIGLGMDSLYGDDYRRCLVCLPCGVCSCFLFEELPGDSHFVGDKILYSRPRVPFAFFYLSTYDTTFVSYHGGRYFGDILTCFGSFEALLLLGDFLPALVLLLD